MDDELLLKKCVHETQKIVDKEYEFYIKSRNFSTSVSRASEKVYLFVFISLLFHDWFPLEFVFTYMFL